MARILLINVPHKAIGSRIPDDHLPPLGLLAVGGPLIDAGHDVELLDCEFGPMMPESIQQEIARRAPDMLLFGHSGSTSAHPVIADVARRAVAARPGLRILYGGVYPTYHWKRILLEEPYVTAIVLGEGEATTVELVSALVAGTPLEQVKGVAFSRYGHPHATAPAPMIRDLDACRIGWELIDHARYSYWGGRRAVIMQFSRGCPHPCTYCGQRGFWTRWRHRTPEVFAAEIARLHREHGVTFVNLADENPTSSPKAWRRFLEAMISENVPVEFAGSTRADDIVRDADSLHLYRKAGIVRWLLGMENTDEETLRRVRKGGATTTDRQAIELLRRNGIVSMATWVAGFGEETHADLWRGLRQLMAYDPDQIQLLYATPHRWTPYFAEVAGRRIIQPDQERWDYKHQVLESTRLKPWQLFLWMKTIEVAMQARPKALQRTLFHRDPAFRHAMRWYTRMGRRVWVHEIAEFLLADRRIADGPTIAAYWGEFVDSGENAHSVSGTHAQEPRKPSPATGRAGRPAPPTSPHPRERRA